MTETADSQRLLNLLERTPGVFWASRLDPATGKSEWVYLGPRMAELYGIPLDVIQNDSSSLMESIVPEDRARLEAKMAHAIATLTPMNWVGRIAHPSGKLRWLESQTNVEREAEGGKIMMCGQVLDVSDRKATELALAEAEAARARTDALYRQVIDAMPIGIMVANLANEMVIMNPVQRKLSGGLLDDHGGDVAGAYGIFKADGKTPLPMDETGMSRGLRGEVLEEEVVLRNPRLPADVRLRVAWTPLRDENGKVYAALGASQDITLQRALESELRARNEELSASEEANTGLIERLRYAVDELSNPILEVWDDVLAMPVIGVVDSRRTSDMVQRLLAEVARTQASFVIVDLTGVEIVDTKTADHMMKLIRKVELVGARCVLTGIRPAVAETLVDIGVDFGRLTTLRNLKHGLREALRFRRRERDWARASDADDAEVTEANGRR